MKRILFFAALLCLICSCGPKGYTGYSWEYHELDSRYDGGTDTSVQEAIAAYDSLMAPLQEIVCYSNDVYSKQSPESALSNYSVDAVRNFAEKYTGEQIDVALLNFGGMRTDLPKGAVRVYDIISIFPFNNYLTILEVNGSTLKRLFDSFARRHKMEALSGVRMKIDGDRVAECTVAGKKIDLNRVYKVATIDFLVTGGDGIDWGDGIIARNDTGVLLRDVIISEMKEAMAAGKTLDLAKDGRIVMTNTGRK